jgi:hypothetical protein
MSSAIIDLLLTIDYWRSRMSGKGRGGYAVRLGQQPDVGAQPRCVADVLSIGNPTGARVPSAGEEMTPYA